MPESAGLFLRKKSIRGQEMGGRLWYATDWEAAEMESVDFVERTLAVIEARLRERLSVDDLAESAAFSKYYYQRLFREAVGESVMRYVARRRMELAAVELAGGGATVLEIALNCGYDSHEGFTRAFKAHMGVTPADYRKFRLSPPPIYALNGGITMSYSKTTEEIARTLNRLTVQARAAAAQAHACGEEAEHYRSFWFCMESGAAKLAGGLETAQGQVREMLTKPEDFLARFALLKAMEEMAFEANVTAFQAQLMVARARPADRDAFAPVCKRFQQLAEDARLGTKGMAAFLKELAELILRDRESRLQRLAEEAVKAGREAAAALSPPELPYGYLARRTQRLAEKLEKSAGCGLMAGDIEDCLLRLDILLSAAGMDLFRAPAHRPLFTGLFRFRELTAEMAEYLQGWKEPAAKVLPQGTKGMEELVTLSLRGEFEKLGRVEGLAEREDSFETICLQLERTLESPEGRERGLEEAYARLREIALELGEYGGAVAWLVERVKGLG